ncbi:hypothetical protein L3Q82_014585, partial [Scortum barcoo]
GLIHPDQACAIPGRKITDSLILIRDTICYARDRNIRLVVLNLDFEKAFDRVSHQYLFQEREPVSPVRGLALGEPSTVWRNVNHPALPNRLRDLSWMVAHEILPVRSVMHSRGMSTHSTCPRPGCGAPESQGEASALGVQRCRRPVGNGRLLTIPVLASKGGPYSTAGAVW